MNLPLVAAGQPGAEITLDSGAGANIHRSVLPGGVRLLTETIPGQHSATFGAWLAVGSRDETDGHYGSTHFLEHLLFKRTRNRDALEIASAFDAVGGETNAATAKEYTCYYARVLDADLPMATEVILDMVTSAVLQNDDFETERGVILEELAMAEDDPSDVAHEAFATAVHGEHPLGRPIGGTPQTIEAVPRDAVWEHYRSTYTAPRLVITAAGGVDHQTLAAQVQQALATGGWDLDPAGVPAARRPSQPQTPPKAGIGGPETGGFGERAATLAPMEQLIVRPVEQANILLGGPGPVATDERRFALAVLHAILGGSMSSRLFQEIREKRGLAYSVYSFSASYSDAGSFGLYAGCAPAKVGQVVELLIEQLDLLAKTGISDAELARGIGQVRGNLVLGLEDSSARMSRLGRAELAIGTFLPVEQNLRLVAAVTRETIHELAAELHAAPRHLLVVGPDETKLPQLR